MSFFDLFKPAKVEAAEKQTVDADLAPYYSENNNFSSVSKKNWNVGVVHYIN